MTILDRITEARRHGSRAIPVEIDEIERLRTELDESARLLGMSGERELDLRVQVERLQRELALTSETLDEISGDTKKWVRRSIVAERALHVCRSYFDAYVAEKAADRTYCYGPVHYDMARKFEAAVYPERVR